MSRHSSALMMNIKCPDRAAMAEEWRFYSVFLFLNSFFKASLVFLGGVSFF